MRCPNCGNEIPEGRRFCGHCGHRLDPGPAPDVFDDSAPTRLTAPEPVQEPEQLAAPEPPQAPAPPEPEAPSPPAKASRPRGGQPAWVWILVGSLIILVVVAVVAGVINRPQPASPGPQTGPTSPPAAAANPTSRPAATSKPAATARPSEPTPAPESSWETFGDSFELISEDVAGLAAGEGDFYLSFDARQISGYDPVSLIIMSEYTGIELIEVSVWFDAGHYLIIYGAWEKEGDSSSINAGFGTWNHVEVVGEDDVLSIYFNGSRLAALDRPTREVATEVQFTAWGPATAEIRDVYVEGR